MNSAGDVYENALFHQQELSDLDRYEELAKHNVLLVEASYDRVAPPELMLSPLAGKLKECNAHITYESIFSNHSFVGQRMKLTKVVGKWLQTVVFS